VRALPTEVQGLPAVTQAEYARLRAVIELRIRELRSALDDHEALPENWSRTELLEQIERALADLVESVAT